MDNRFIGKGNINSQTTRALKNILKTSSVVDADKGSDYFLKIDAYINDKPCQYKHSKGPVIIQNEIIVPLRITKGGMAYKNSSEFSRVQQGLEDEYFFFRIQYTPSRNPDYQYYFNQIVACRGSVVRECITGSEEIYAYSDGNEVVLVKIPIERCKVYRK
jgi:hypothetical protein